MGVGNQRERGNGYPCFKAASETIKIIYNRLESVRTALVVRGQLSDWEAEVESRTGRGREGAGERVSEGIGERRGEREENAEGSVCVGKDRWRREDGLVRA